MKKRYLVTATILLIAGFTKMTAQQLPLYSNYFFTPFIYNPAQSGTNGSTELTVLHRRQWADVQGSPETSALAINGSLNEQKIGWSVYGFRDITDIISRTGIYGNYAYHLQLADNTSLSFGFGAGYINNMVDQSAIRAKDAEAIITVTTDNRGNFDLNTGANLKIADFTLGLAIPQLLAPSIEYTQNTTTPVNYSLIRHYVINASYDFRFKGQDNILTPIFMLKSAKNVPIQFDAGAIFNLKEYGYVGAMFRSDYAVTANIGLNLTEELTVGYAYDFSTNTFASSLGVSHEFMLKYRFGSDKKLDRLAKDIKKNKVNIKKQQDKIEKSVEDIIDERLSGIEQTLVTSAADAAKKAAQDAQINNPTGRGRNPTTNNPENPGQPNNPKGGAPDNNPTTPTGDRGDGNVNSDPPGYSPSQRADNVAPGSKGYYVVAGVFGNQANAEKLVNRLNGQGVSARYFQDKSNLFHYVYLLKFNSYQEAERAKSTNMNGSYSGDLWIKIVE